jgi:hypothetical protein
VARTVSGGAVIQREVYTPFGALNLLQNERVGEEGFTGHVRDGSGVNYMKARYYMARSSRFLSPDPVGFAQGGPAYFNRYAYVANDPVNGTDPTGQVIETVWDVANIGMGVASFGANVATGNVVGAVVDGLGIVADVAATAVPGLPGGAGVAIKSARAANVARNAANGARREGAVRAALRQENPNAAVQSQSTLRRADGSRAVDSVSGKGRRPDEAVIENGSARTIETTSPTANKTQQADREQRIHESGDVFVRNRETGELVPVPKPSEVRRVPRRRRRRNVRNGRLERCKPARSFRSRGPIL